MLFIKIECGALIWNDWEVHLQSLLVFHLRRKLCPEKNHRLTWKKGDEKASFVLGKFTVSMSFSGRKVCLCLVGKLKRDIGFHVLPGARINFYDHELRFYDSFSGHFFDGSMASLSLSFFTFSCHNLASAPKKKPMHCELTSDIFPEHILNANFTGLNCFGFVFIGCAGSGNSNFSGGVRNMDGIDDYGWSWHEADARRETAETAIAECLPHSAHITSDSSEMDVGNLKFPFHD